MQGASGSSRRLGEDHFFRYARVDPVAFRYVLDVAIVAAARLGGGSVAAEAPTAVRRGLTMTALLICSALYSGTGVASRSRLRSSSGPGPAEARALAVIGLAFRSGSRRLGIKGHAAQSRRVLRETHATSLRGMLDRAAQNRRESVNRGPQSKAQLGIGTSARGQARAAREVQEPRGGAT